MKLVDIIKRMNKCSEKHALDRMPVQERDDFYYCPYPKLLPRKMCYCQHFGTRVQVLTQEGDFMSYRCMYDKNTFELI